MRSVKFLIAAGAASLLSSVAFAADMPIAPPPMYAPPAGRGFRRLVSARRYRLHQSARQVVSTTRSMRNDHLVGPEPRLRHCRHLRPRRRLPVQQLVPRATSPVHIAASRSSSAPTRITFPGCASAPTPTRAPSPSGSFMANAYVDLGTWWCITPFIGAGVGGARYNQRFRAPDHGVGNTSAAARLPSVSHFGDNGRSGISPGRSMPVSPTRSRRTSRSNSPIATSTSATA